MKILHRGPLYPRCTIYISTLRQFTMHPCISSFSLFLSKVSKVFLKETVDSILNSTIFLKLAIFMQEKKNRFYQNACFWLNHLWYKKKSWYKKNSYVISIHFIINLQIIFHSLVLNFTWSTSIIESSLSAFLLLDFLFY